MRDIARFFVRYQIDPENLLYLTREEQRTVLHLLDGSTVTTSIPQKEIRAWLGDEDFINICKIVCVVRKNLLWENRKRLCDFIIFVICFAGFIFF